MRSFGKDEIAVGNSSSWLLNNVRISKFASEAIDDGIAEWRKSGILALSYICHNYTSILVTRRKLTFDFIMTQSKSCYKFH